MCRIPSIDASPNSVHVPASAAFVGLAWGNCSDSDRVRWAKLIQLALQLGDWLGNGCAFAVHSFCSLERARVLSLSVAKSSSAKVSRILNGLRR
jgi:hypothetical protein